MSTMSEPKIHVPDFDTCSRETLTPPLNSNPNPNPAAAAVSRTAKLLTHTRTFLCALSCAMSIVILALAARNLEVYHATSLGSGYLLPLWPQKFNIKSTVALVVVGALMAVFSAVTVVFAHMKSTLTNTFLSILFPCFTFVCAVVATIHHFAANSSSTTDTFETWSCEWKHVSMNVEPHFGTLCSQAKASIRLTVAVIPLQVVIMGIVLVAFVAEKAAKWRNKAMGA